ncbi:hypothetical protein CDIK_1724 [Cucumispora dikerogammari]|nr:hypothetical protein CDIK_1724 [Cucumispora dikerogammari]
MYLAKKSFHFSVQKLIFDINIWNQPVYSIICSQKNTQLNKVDLSAKESVSDTSERIMNHGHLFTTVPEHFLSSTHSPQRETLVNYQHINSCQYTEEFTTTIYYPGNNKSFLLENTEEQVVDELIPMIELPLSNIEINPQYNTRNLSKTNTEQHIGSTETIKMKDFFQSAAESHNYYKNYAFHQELPPVCNLLGYNQPSENPSYSQFYETSRPVCDNLATQYHFKNDIQSQLSEYQLKKSGGEYQAQKNSSTIKRKMDNTSDSYGCSHNKLQTFHKDALCNNYILPVDTTDRSQNLNYVTQERLYNDDTNCHQSDINFQKQQQDNTSHILRSEEYKSCVKLHDSSVYSTKCFERNTKINQTAESIQPSCKSSYPTLQKKFILHDVQEDKNFFKAIDEISNETVIKAIYIKSPKTPSTVRDQKITSDKLFSFDVQLKYPTNKTGTLAIQLSIRSVPVFLIPEYLNHQNCDNFVFWGGKSKRHKLNNDITIIFTPKIQTGICVSDILPEFVFTSRPNIAFSKLYIKKIYELKVSNTKINNILPDNKIITHSNRTKSQNVEGVAKTHEIKYFLRRLYIYEQNLKREKIGDHFLNIVFEKLKILLDHIKEVDTNRTFSEYDINRKLRQIRIFKKEFEINDFPIIFSGGDSPEAHDLKAAYLKVYEWIEIFVCCIPGLENYLN